MTFPDLSQRFQQRLPTEAANQAVDVQLEQAQAAPMRLATEFAVATIDDLACSHMAMHEYIFRRERVTVLAKLLAGVLCAKTLAAQHILAVSNRLKMGGIHAVTASAKMVDHEPLRNSTNQQFVSVAMGGRFDSTVVEDAMARVFLPAQPRPTIRSATYVNLLPESLLFREGRAPFQADRRIGQRDAISHQAVIVRPAIASAHYRSFTVINSTGSVTHND